MVANINTMMYAREVPWHSLGKKVDGLQTSEAAIKAAGLDYEVQKFPVEYEIPSSEAKRFSFPRHQVTVRMDNLKPLGLVGQGYKVLQNREAFTFMDYLIGEKAAMFETAGALGDGERVWMLAEIPGYIRTIGEDVSKKYLLLANGHDGSLAVHVMFTPIRVVCQNTLNAALGESKGRFTIFHTENFADKMKEAKQVLGLANAHFNIFEDLSKQLVGTKMNDEQFKKYAKDVVFPAKKKTTLADVEADEVAEEEKQSTRAENIMLKLSQLFEDGQGTEIPGVRGTVWAGYNAITEYTDHVRGKNLAKRANSLLFGSSALMKQRAMNAALQLVK